MIDADLRCHKLMEESAKKALDGNSFTGKKIVLLIDAV